MVAGMEQGRIDDSIDYNNVSGVDGANIAGKDNVKDTDIVLGVNAVHEAIDDNASEEQPSAICSQVIKLESAEGKEDNVDPNFIDNSETEDSSASVVDNSCEQPKLAEQEKEFYHENNFECQADKQVVEQTVSCSLNDNKANNIEEESKLKNESLETSEPVVEQDIDKLDGEEVAEILVDSKNEPDKAKIDIEQDSAKEFSSGINTEESGISGVKCFSYRVFAGAAQGDKYIKEGLKDCQDSVLTLCDDSIQIIAVADGHGSRTCFRSHIGSKLAVKAAVGVVNEYYKCCNYIPLDEEKICSLKSDICSKWRSLVKEHWDSLGGWRNLDDNNEERWNSVDEKYRARFQSEQESERYLYRAYGTTLLVAAATESQVLLLQIGDGSCIVFDNSGQYSKPIAADAECFLNVTTSICYINAKDKMRHVTFEGSLPVAVFLSSDGIDDCYPVFENDKYLADFYREILRYIVESGGDFKGTEDDIENEHLKDIAANDSRDDTSLAYLISTDMDKLSSFISAHEQ